MDSASLDAELIAQANSLRRLARDLLGDPHLAEDAVQDALHAAIERPPAARSALGAWLRTVITRRALDLRRRERRRHAYEQASARETTTVSAAATDHQVEMQQRVLAAVQSIAEPYRTTIWQRYYEDRSPTEIAALRGEPVKTVKTQLWRALQRLRQQLDAQPGSRGAWMALLRPFATPTQPAILGVALMSAATKFGIAATVLLAMSMALWWVSTEVPQAPAAPGATGALAVTAVSAETGARADVDNAASDRSPAPVPVMATPIVSFPLPSATPPLPIDGVVLDLDARAVAGIEVTWNGSPFAPPAVTGGNGVFRGERPLGTGRLGIADDRFVPVLEPVLFDTDRVHTELTIVVAPSVRLAGVVVDADGMPIWSAQLAVTLGLPLRTRIGRVLDRCVDAKFETMTPDDGTFTILAAPLVATARLVITAPGHQPLEVPVDDARHLDRFELQRIVAGDVLEGVVIDVDGAIVRQAVLVLHDHSVVTEPDGTFRIELWRVGGLPAGTLPEITVATSDHLPGKVGCLSPQWRTLGAWPAPLRVQVGGRVATIRGRVLRHDGTPFADPWVSFAPPEPEQIRPTLFDSFHRPAAPASTIDAAAGEFETARVAPGRYRLRVFHPLTLEVFVTEPIATGTMPVEIRMPDRGLWPALRGVVVDRRGNPVAGADWLLERDDPLPGATEPVTGSWLRATDAGVMEHPPVSRDVRTLCVKAAGMAEWVRIELASLPHVDDFRVIVPLGCQTRIEVGPNWQGVDRAHLVDGTGARSPVVFTNGDIAHGTRVIPLVEGSSQTFAALDDCVELVLCRADQEVGRVPVALRPGELNLLRP